jgi:hypothetical protein
MSALSASRVIVQPSYILPEALLQYNQVSGAFQALADDGIMSRLSEGDLYTYVKKVEVRTKVAAGQVAGNQLPGVQIVTSMGSIPTYLIRTRSEYDHHDTAAMSKWDMALPELHRLGMRQGIFQQMRSALLYGFNPQNGEGLLNAVGATAVPLPADTNGHTTVLTYDNGQMALFLLAQIAELKTRTFQLGMPSKIVIVGPQRVLSTWTYQGIVQLTSYQREGGGTATVGVTVDNVATENGDEIEWCFDDTLIGKGSGGRDAVIITIPSVQRPQGQVSNGINTNEFAKLANGLSAVNLMLCDMAAPREIPTPLPGGAIDVVAELRVTPGWNLRSEAITIISAQYQ